MVKRDIVGKLAHEMTLHRDQVQRTVGLLDEGNTVPFVARYRKEVTGGLDEAQLRTILDPISPKDLKPVFKDVYQVVEQSGVLAVFTDIGHT